MRAAFAERVRACVVAGAVGDALGAGVEFQSLAEIRRVHGPRGVERPLPCYGVAGAVITDDTQMTLFTLEGLIRAQSGDVEGSVHRAHRRWLATQRLSSPRRGHVELPGAGGVDLDGGLSDEAWLYALRAPGNACMSGLSSRRMGTPAHPQNPGSKGCGAVMRSAPFGLVPAWSPEEAFTRAAECGAQTHGHPTGYVAAGAFAAIVRHLLAGEPLAGAVGHTVALLDAHENGAETRDALAKAVAAAAQGIPSPELLESLGEGWIAEEALAMSVYCALAHADDTAAALLLAVNHSGDSDSTGAITGNLLGLRNGLTGIPDAWLSALEGRTTIEGVSDAFAKHFAS
ncbi:ADP-ribosylglycohydrolase family protein [Actinocorallia sp. A-T 12471]|uniref:ADP-ribosylglycohydrolase family protein n=1 Tax=Actinocorallia sp. A-T 12471 TaxID=3089813 RepID=UPI0029CCDDA9|nr:ADP-ribosylglycohydrolase family protein [Actinocorallia sp. A-T 12471]MDX6739237.1 ADP-ribosylglycohydrolase family protein [Actinocorallia sp. A-T 12471]